MEHPLVEVELRGVLDHLPVLLVLDHEVLTGSLKVPLLQRIESLGELRGVTHVVRKVSDHSLDVLGHGIELSLRDGLVDGREVFPLYHQIGQPLGLGGSDLNEVVHHVFDIPRRNPSSLQVTSDLLR